MNNTFFDNLNEDINNAKTHKALIVLTRRLNSFVRTSIESPYITAEDKKRIKKKYSIAIKKIKRLSKKLKDC